ncbi:MAG: hypothetical protein EHM40_08885 [Chloroflexi bacterium]|nr:MAG: hypothetical protein EHM40_08885 [Chloroflexota bacterium]
MTKIVGLEDIQSDGQLQQEIQQGGKFVMYQYCISLLIITFKRPTNIYFIRQEESAVVKGLPFTLLSFLLGWWGIPWGPIYTIQSIWINFKGGKDVTDEVLASIVSASQRPA